MFSHLPIRSQSSNKSVFPNIQDGHIFIPNKNCISDSLFSIQEAIHKNQERLFKEWLNNEKVKSYSINPFSQPLFIKANSQISVAYFISLDDLASKKGEYKLSFSKELDSKSKYEFNFLSKELFKEFPKEIFGYKKLIPDSIISNSIFFL